MGAGKTNVIISVFLQDTIWLATNEKGHSEIYINDLLGSACTICAG